jgi:hypothetical protein
MPSDPLLLIGLAAVICGLGVFFDWFYKKFPRAEKLSGLQIWAIWAVFWLLALFIAAVIGKNA